MTFGGTAARAGPGIELRWQHPGFLFPFDLLLFLGPFRQTCLVKIVLTLAACPRHCTCSIKALQTNWAGIWWLVPRWGCWCCRCCWCCWFCWCFRCRSWHLLTCWMSGHLAVGCEVCLGFTSLPAFGSGLTRLGFPNLFNEHLKSTAIFSQVLSYHIS